MVASVRDQTAMEVQGSLTSSPECRVSCRTNRAARATPGQPDQQTRIRAGGGHGPPRSPAPGGRIVAASGNRVVPATAERVAATDAPNRQTATLDDTVLGDGLVAVLGARRLEPARRRQHGGDESLVAADEPERWCTHDGAFSPQQSAVSLSIILYAVSLFPGLRQVFAIPSCRS